jgi:ribosomal protein L37AE/L43A
MAFMAIGMLVKNGANYQCPECGAKLIPGTKVGFAIDLKKCPFCVAAAASAAKKQKGVVGIVRTKSGR